MTWTLTPAGDYAGHISRWNELNAASVASPLLDAGFVAPLLDHFGTGRERLAICERGGRAVAMALLAPRGAGVWSSFQPPQQPLCMWLSAPGEPLGPLLDGLLRALPGFPLLLGLTQCDPRLTPRPAAGARQRTLDYIDTARVALGGGYDAYWEGRGKNLRANLKKQRNRLEREGVATRLQLSRAPEEMAAAVADYGRLESAGWKGGQGTAVHAGNAQGGFYQAMLEAFCRRGAGCAVRYWFGERLVAMDLCIEGKDSVIVLKTAYDEGVDKHFSPALLMREESFRLLFQRPGLHGVEFYGKVMPWHLQWTDEVRTMYHINHYRWPLLLRLHARRSSTE